MKNYAALLKPFGGEITSIPNGNGVIVGIYHGKFNKELFDVLSLISNLEILVFYVTKLTDDDLAFISQLKSLKKLGFLSCAISDIGLIHLQRLHHLAELQLHETLVTSEGIAKLKAKLPELKISL